MKTTIKQEVFFSSLQLTITNFYADLHPKVGAKVGDRKSWAASAECRTGCPAPCPWSSGKVETGNATERRAGRGEQPRSGGGRGRSNGREQGAEIETGGAHIHPSEKMLPRPLIPERVVAPKNMLHDFLLLLRRPCAPAAVVVSCSCRCQCKVFSVTYVKV